MNIDELLPPALDWRGAYPAPLLPSGQQWHSLEHFPVESQRDSVSRSLRRFKGRMPNRGFSADQGGRSYNKTIRQRTQVGVKSAAKITRLLVQSYARMPYRDRPDKVLRMIGLMNWPILEVSLDFLRENVAENVVERIYRLLVSLAAAETDRMLELVDDESEAEHVRACLLRVVAELKEGVAVRTALRASRLGSPVLRDVAAEILGRYVCIDFVRERLTRLAEKDESEAVRETARDALGSVLEA